MPAITAGTSAPASTSDSGLACRKFSFQCMNSWLVKWDTIMISPDTPMTSDQAPAIRTNPGFATREAMRPPLPDASEEAGRAGEASRAEPASSPASNTPVTANQTKRLGGSSRGVRTASAVTVSAVTRSVSRRKSRTIMGMNISYQALMGRSPRPLMKKSSGT